MPIKATGEIKASNTIDLDTVIRDFKSINNSDFGYDSAPHFLDFLESK